MEYNFYAAIDQYPPVIHSCSYDLLSGPSVGIEVNAQDVTSGLHGVSACMGGNCWQSVGNSVTIPLIGLDFNVEIASEDVAGNLSEPTTCTIHFDLNDFIAEVNVPSLVTASPLALELSGGEYNGPYIISIDDNSWESNASAVIPLSAGQHSLCIFVTDHNDINRCFEFNVDLAPPVVSLSAPTISRTRSVTVSWSASDDLYLSSVQLLVDGSAQDVPPSGSMALTLSYGSHNICVRATDLADRYSEECTRVLIRRPGGGGGGRPTPLPPSPKFPRDDMDREFLEILRFAGIEYNTVEQSGESSGAGIPRGASQLVTVAEEEFNRDFVPIPSRWIVREYVVDGEKYVFVLRRVSPEIERVYEYFPEDVNVYSPYLVRVFRGSLLAVFENSGEYYYVASAGNAGLPLYEVPPLPVKFRRERVEENVPVLQPHEENVTEVQKAAVTPYAVLGGVNERAVVAGLFVLAGVLALLLSYRRR